MTSMREQARSRDLTAPWVAWDAWRATHGRPAGIAARQAARLEALVACTPGFPAFTRAHGCGGASLRLATEPPQVNPGSGETPTRAAVGSPGGD